MAAKKKVIATVSAVAASAALLLGGTLAWQSTNQTALNEGSNIINPGGRLHDDFDGTNKDVYVENFADEDIFARIRLEEYFEIIVNQGTPAETPYTIIGEKTLKEGAAADPENNPSGANLYDYTYEVHNFNTTDNKTENAGLDGDTPYWKWTLGGETVYMPTFNMNKDSLAADLNGEYRDAVGGISNRDGTQYKNYKTYTEGQDSEPGTEIYDDDVDTDDEVGRNFDSLAEYDGDIVTVADKVHTAKKTENAQLISMADWIAMVGDSYDEAAHGNYWVYDEDGWVYWSAPIKPDTATGLLLDGIELNQKMDDTWYYAINVVAQFVTADDLGSKDDGTGFFDTAKGPAPSDNAISLLDKIGVDVGTAGEGDDPIETDEFAVRVTDTEGNSWTTVDGKLELSPSVMPGYTLSVANDAYSADDYTWEITENSAVMDSELWDNGNGTFSLFAGFDEHDGSYVVITVTEKATNEVAATVKITLDEDNQYPDPEPDAGETDITTLTITADPHDWYVPTGGTSYVTLTAQLTENGEVVENADLSSVEWSISAKARSSLDDDTAIASNTDGTATLTIAPGETNNILVTASYTDAVSNETYTGELVITNGPPVATIWAYDMDAEKFVSKLDYPLNGATYNVKLYFFPEYTGTIQPIDKAYSGAEAEALASKLNISTDVGVDGVTVTQNESDRSVIKVTIAPNVAAEFSIHYDIDGGMHATLDFNPPAPELVWTGRDSADPQGAVYLAPGESAEYELINLPDSYDLTDISYSVKDLYETTAENFLCVDESNGRKVTVTHDCADECTCYEPPFSVCAEFDGNEITSANAIYTQPMSFALLWEDSFGYAQSRYYYNEGSDWLYDEAEYTLYLSSGDDIKYTGDDNNFTWSCVDEYGDDGFAITDASNGDYVRATFTLDRTVENGSYYITAANEDGKTYTLNIYWDYTPDYSVDIWNDSTADTYTQGNDTISFYAVVYDSDWESPANFAKDISWTIEGEGKGNAAITYYGLNEYEQETFTLNTADADGPLTLTAVYTAADGEKYSSEPITLNVVYPAAEGFKLDEESTSFVHPANSYVMEYTDSDNNSYTSFEITEDEYDVANIDENGSLVISEDAPEHAKVVIAVKNGAETVEEIPLTVSHKMTFKVTSQVPGGDKELSRNGDVDYIWAGDTVEVWLGNDVQVSIDYFDQPELGVIYPEDYEAYGLALGYDAEGNNIMSCTFNQAHGFGINAIFESSTGATISDHMGVDVQWHYFVKAEYKLNDTEYIECTGETIFLKDTDTLTIRAYGVDMEDNRTPEDDQPTTYEWFIGENGNNPTENTDAFGQLEEGVSTETGAEYTITKVASMADNQTYQFYISTELHNFCTVEVVKGKPSIDGPAEVSTNTDDNYFSTNTGKGYTFSVADSQGNAVDYAHFATDEDEYPHGSLILSEEAPIGSKLIITATPDGFEGEPLTKEVTIVEYDGSDILLDVWDDYGYATEYRKDSEITFTTEIYNKLGEYVDLYYNDNVVWTAVDEEDNPLPEDAFVDNYDGSATLSTYNLNPADIGNITVTVTYNGEDRGKNYTDYHTLTPYIAPLSYIDLAPHDNQEGYAHVAPVIDNAGDTAVYLVARDDEGEDCSDRVIWDCDSDLVDEVALESGKVTAANDADLTSPFDKVTITATDKENPDSIVYYTVMMYDSAVHSFVNSARFGELDEYYHVFREATANESSTEYCVMRHDLPAAYCTLRLDYTYTEDYLDAEVMASAYDAMLADPGNKFGGVTYLGVCTHGQDGANDNYPQDKPPMFSVGRGSDILASGIYAGTTFDRAYPGDTLQVTSTILNNAWSVSLGGEPIEPTSITVDPSTRSRLSFTIPADSTGEELVITQTIDGVDYSISTIVEDPGPTFTVKLNGEVIADNLPTSGNMYLPIIGMTEPVEVTVTSSRETAWYEETGNYHDWHVYGAYENYVPVDDSNSNSITMTLSPSELTDEIIYVDQPRDDYRYWEITMYVTEAKAEHQ